MKHGYVCNDCFQEITASEYEKQNDIFCSKCGGKFEEITESTSEDVTYSYEVHDRFSGEIENPKHGESRNIFIGRCKEKYMKPFVSMLWFYEEKTLPNLKYLTTSILICLSALVILCFVGGWAMGEADDHARTHRSSFSDSSYGPAIGVGLFFGGGALAAFF